MAFIDDVFAEIKRRTDEKLDQAEELMAQAHRLLAEADQLAVTKIPVTYIDDEE